MAPSRKSSPRLDPAPLRRWRNWVIGVLAIQALFTIGFLVDRSVSAWRNQLHHGEDRLAERLRAASAKVNVLGAIAWPIGPETPRLTGPGWKAWLSQMTDLPETGTAGVEWALWFPGTVSGSDGWSLVPHGRLPRWERLPRPEFIGDHTPENGHEMRAQEGNGIRRTVVWKEVVLEGNRGAWLIMTHRYPVITPPSYMTPWLVVLAGLFLCLGSGLLIYLLYRRLERWARHIGIREARAGITRRRLERFVEHHPDIQLTLDGAGHVTQANGVVHTHLGLRPSRILGKAFPSVFLQGGRPEMMAQVATVMEHVGRLSRQRGKVELAMECFHHLAGESRYFQVTLESFGNARERNPVFVRMAAIWSSNHLPAIRREHLELTGGHSLIQSETLSHLACRNLIKYLTETEATTLRIALREILINAMEHGNLNIRFSEKTQALAEDRYFDLIRSRREDPRYAHRQVHVDVFLDEHEFRAVVRDEGEGFDHRGFLEKAARLNRMKLAHGRGISMALAAFDEVHYNEVGNRVVLIKSMKHRLTHAERLRRSIQDRWTEPDLERAVAERRRKAVGELEITRDWVGLGVISHPIEAPGTAENPYGLDREGGEPDLEPVLVEVAVGGR